MQVVRIYPDIAIVHNDVLVPRLRQHLRQVADFDIGAEDFFTQYEPDGNLRELRLQSLYKSNCWIVGVADPEDDFVFGIILQTMAAKALIHLRVGTLEWLENVNWWKRLCGAGALAHRFSPTQKPSRAIQAEDVITQAANRNRPGGSRDDGNDAVNHPE